MPKTPVISMKELPQVLKELTGELDIKFKKVELKTKNGWEVFEGEKLANLLNDN